MRNNSGVEYGARASCPPAAIHNLIPIIHTMNRIFHTLFSSSLAPRLFPLIFLLLCFGLFLAVRAEEPAKKPAEKKASRQKTLQEPASSYDPDEGGKARVGLFGLVGEGYKFVFVFDRSGSMGGDGRQSLKAVKAELIRGLKGLGRVHQFQIVFYNERPVLFNPSGASGRLAFATEENKQRVERFLDTITADGGTDHEEALRLAIRLHPDVIFFLTDGDDPKLTPAQVEKISRRAAGIVIHCIEFGPGPKPEGASFLADLARQNAENTFTSTFPNAAAASAAKGRALVRVSATAGQTEMFVQPNNLPHFSPRDEKCRLTTGS